MSNEIDTFSFDDETRRLLELKEELTGNNLYIYVDDTAISGNQSPNECIADISKSYIGVAVDKKTRSKLMAAMNFLLGEIRKEGRSEFHFVDIYNHKGEWKNVTTEEVLKCFDAFSTLVKEARISFNIQSCDKESEKKLKAFFNDPTTKDSFRSKNLPIMGYEMGIVITLLNKIDDTLKSKVKRKYDTAYVYVDEGILNANQKIAFNSSILSNVANRVVIKFKSSKEEPLLQIADFFAYSYLRHQFLIKKLKDEGKELLDDEFYGQLFEYIGIAMECGVGKGFEKVVLEDDNINKQSIEEVYKNIAKKRKK